MQFKWFQEECSPLVLQLILFIGYWPASLEKKTVFAYNAKTRAVTAQLMSATKPIRTFKPVAIFRACTSWFVSDLGGNPKDMLSSLGAQ